MTQLALQLAKFKALYHEFTLAHRDDVRVCYVSELTVCVRTRMFGFVVDVFRVETSHGHVRRLGLNVLALSVNALPPCDTMARSLLLRSATRRIYTKFRKKVN